MAKRAATKQEKAARAKPAPLVSLEQSPARTVVLRRVKDLKENPRNVRTHPVAQLAVLDESFSDHGQVKPLVINEAGELLAGHGSCASLLHLYGPDAEVACVILAQDDTLQRKFMVRDNAGAEMSGWDKPRLGLELADLKSLGVPNLAALGFKPAMLTKLLPEQPREGFSDPDAEAPTAPIEAVSRPGDVWLLGDHRLMCGDATHADRVAALVGAEMPVLMVTDQPYGVEYDAAWREGDGSDALAYGGGNRAVGQVQNDNRADWRAAFALFRGEVAYIWCASLFLPEAVASLEACEFERRALIIWRKHQAAISRGHYHWQHEPCLYMVRKGGTGHWQGSRTETTIWDIEGTLGPSGKKQDTITGHGTQKPIECMARPMRNNSPPGALVYDPFCGSGTTIIAGEMLARRVRAMEIMPAYVDVAVRRWENFTKKRALLAAGGLTMEAVAAARAAEAKAA